ncbi:TIGR02646 family protein [Pectobacterium versatile]|uniref:TIGR02646 family protein n=1 Tax=Pectobacterium versatile TaxID=2488639 RepID=UPI001BB2DA34|nr:TIGR02646 family protein [Pectobacterium versatile]
MRRITKGAEPVSLTAWKRANPTGRYDDLIPAARQDIRDACTKEQFGLCAYCCRPISGDHQDTMNEHVQARNSAPQRSLDFTNIVASCKTPDQCDAAHGSQSFSLTPLMAACETELQFMISGRITGTTSRAQDTIRVLNLGDSETHNKKLIETRKQAINTILWTNGIEPDEGLEDDELLQSIINDLCTPKNGLLEPYAPVLVNILRGWLSV